MNRVARVFLSWSSCALHSPALLLVLILILVLACYGETMLAISYPDWKPCVPRNARITGEFVDRDPGTMALKSYLCPLNVKL
jgi:hypothetical protein